MHGHDRLESGAIAPEESPALIFGVRLRVWLEFIACGVALLWPMVLMAWGVGFEGNASSLLMKLLILAATACVGASVISVLIYRINAPTNDKTVRTLTIIGVAVCLGIFALGSGAQILTMLLLSI
jgi:hypothetical protein